MDTTTRWLRIEGAAVLVAVLTAYAASGSSWLLFIGLLLVPDLSMLGYLAGPRIGAMSYNAAHLYAWPALLLAGWGAGLAVWTLAPGLVWAAHIALDRALGYGLKEPDSFQHTHLGWIGGASAPAAQPESSSTIGR
jgi:hypothetical protein